MKSPQRSRGVRFGLKVGQIGPKWDKSGTFSDQILVHFGAGRLMGKEKRNGQS